MPLTPRANARTLAFGLVGITAAMIADTPPALAACEDRIPAAQQTLGPHWTPVIGSSYAHASGVALGFDCIEGVPLYAYLQLPLEGSDIAAMQAAVADAARSILATTISENALQNCILSVKPTTDEDVWRPVGKFGKAFQCSKDEHSHYFRIAP